MGKKHKKHHRSDKSDPELAEDEERGEKPLKLVLKVGGGDGETSEGGERKHKHKKKKKHKEKYRHQEYDKKSDKKKDSDEEKEEDISEDEDVPTQMEVDDTDDTAQEDTESEDLLDEPPPAKKTALDDTPAMKRSIRERKAQGNQAPLYKCLDYLQRTLQRKDVNGFFAYPVTDQIAPYYTTIIKQPMDFSSMRNKINNFEYGSVAEYRADFELMCNNCCLYNPEETVYHKEAKKLLVIGQKMLNKEKLVQLKRSLPFMAEILEDELGFDEELPPPKPITDEEFILPPVESTKPDTPVVESKFEAIPDDMTPEEILSQAQAAARAASDRLAQQQPKSKFGFLRRKDDGSTSLTVLNPDNDGIVSDKERVVNLGKLVGKLQQGTPVLPPFKEDKRNKANPVSYLNYGSFSSYAPVYDSTTANITKEESDLLYSTYGDETGVQYAMSLNQFAEGCDDYISRMADSILDTLSHGEHSKTMAIFKQKELEKAQEQKSEETQTETDTTIVPKKEVDLSFLDSVKVKQELSEPEKQTQEKLDSAGELLNDLRSAQKERLLQKHPYVFSRPSDKEAKLAGEVTQKLTELAKQVKPRDISHGEGVRSAMGITVIKQELDTAGDSNNAIVIASPDTTS